MSEGSDIRGRHWWMLHHNDGPDKLATMTEALAEEDYPEFLTATTEASFEEAEDTTRPGEHL